MRKAAICSADNLMRPSRLPAGGLSGAAQTGCANARPSPNPRADNFVDIDIWIVPAESSRGAGGGGYADDRRGAWTPFRIHSQGAKSACGFKCRWFLGDVQGWAASTPRQRGLPAVGRFLPSIAG